MKRVSIEPEVYDDLAEASDWYDAEQWGLGARFLNAMRELMGAIEEAPETFPTESGGVRVGWRKPFPYKMYFVVESSSIRIFAVIHAARNPYTWKARRTAEEE